MNIFLVLLAVVAIIVLMTRKSVEKVVNKPDSQFDIALKEAALKTAMKEFKSELFEGEEIKNAVSGAYYNNSVGYLLLTDKRVLYKGGGARSESLSIGLNKIGQVRNDLSSGGLSDSFIIIEYSGGDAKFGVHNRKENHLFTNACREAIL